MGANPSREEEFHPPWSVTTTNCTTTEHPLHELRGYEGDDEGRGTDRSGCESSSSSDESVSGPPYAGSTSGSTSTRSPGGSKISGVIHRNNNDTAATAGATTSSEGQSMTTFVTVPCLVCDKQFFRPEEHTGRDCCSRKCERKVPVLRQCYKCREAFPAPRGRKQVELCTDCCTTPPPIRDNDKGKEPERVTRPVYQGSTSGSSSSSCSDMQKGTVMEEVRREMVYM